MRVLVLIHQRHNIQTLQQLVQNLQISSVLRSTHRMLRQTLNRLRPSRRQHVPQQTVNRSNTVPIVMSKRQKSPLRVLQRIHRLVAHLSPTQHRQLRRRIQIGNWLSMRRIEPQSLTPKLSNALVQQSQPRFLVQNLLVFNVVSPVTLPPRFLRKRSQKLLSFQQKLRTNVVQ